MQSIQAQLAPVASTLDELTRRVSDLADANSGTQDDLARDLYEVERARRSAHRRLDRLVTGLG
jgi:hypothetical protein